MTSEEIRKFAEKFRKQKMPALPILDDLLAAFGVSLLSGGADSGTPVEATPDYKKLIAAADLFGARVRERCPSWFDEDGTDLAEARDKLARIIYASMAGAAPPAASPQPVPHDPDCDCEICFYEARQSGKPDPKGGRRLNPLQSGTVRLNFSNIRIVDITDCEWKDLRIVIHQMERDGTESMPMGFVEASYGCVHVGPKSLAASNSGTPAAGEWQKPNYFCLVSGNLCEQEISATDRARCMCLNCDNYRKTMGDWYKHSQVTGKVIAASRGESAPATPSAPDEDRPSCHVCGSKMVRCWQCTSCGAASYPTNPEPQGGLLAIAAKVYEGLEINGLVKRDDEAAILEIIQQWIKVAPAPADTKELAGKAAKRIFDEEWRRQCAEEDHLSLKELAEIIEEELKR